MYSTADHWFPKVVKDDAVCTTDSSISSARIHVPYLALISGFSASGNVAFITKISSAPEKTPKMNVDVDKGGEKYNLMVDSYLNRLEFVGAYMTDLNNDDAVWMAALSPSAFNTQVAVEVEDLDKDDLESEFVDPGTQINCDKPSTQYNAWINGELISYSKKYDSELGEYPSATEYLDSWNGQKIRPQDTPNASGWGTCPKVQPTTSAYLSTINAPVISFQKFEDNFKDTSDDPIIILVEWMAAGGGATNIVNADQSINLNEHTIIFDVTAEDSDSVEVNLEDNPEFFEDVIVEYNNVEEVLSAEFMQDIKINLDNFPLIF